MVPRLLLCLLPTLLVGAADEDTATILPVLVCRGHRIDNFGGPKPLCSITFQAEGTCDGQDQIPISRTPWEPAPISILGTEIAVLVQADHPMVTAIAGDNYNPDIMSGYQIGNGSHQTWFPAGYAFKFPPQGWPTYSHIDAHVWCTPVEAKFQVWETIFYSVEGSDKK